MNTDAQYLTPFHNLCTQQEYLQVEGRYFTVFNSTFLGLLTILTPLLLSGPCSLLSCFPLKKPYRLLTLSTESHGSKGTLLGDLWGAPYSRSGRVISKVNTIRKQLKNFRTLKQAALFFCYERSVLQYKRTESTDCIRCISIVGQHNGGNCVKCISIVDQHNGLIELRQRSRLLHQYIIAF
ncbi:hypothetical protein CEXT_662771 [Caerostris extrusa]|uniref:Uncharacterized protein n=1 Tax=Caerostris extrusa TaxID=172846 RepID=A0AAV4PCR6_CAEEX|nr:hypothetical protein CEXT_662771 [Caerostris extrusa]